MTILPIILLLLAIILYLLLASRRPLENIDYHSEARRLIALYETRRTDDEQQAERDYRLYHELKYLRADKAGIVQRRLPLWLFFLILTLLATATYGWYQLGGNNALIWQRAIDKNTQGITAMQYLGQAMLDNIPLQNRFAYCQQLQTRIDRQDSEQLNALAHCYTSLNQFDIAADIYHSLYRLQPENDDAALNYAQASLFSNRQQTMSSEIEQILKHLIAQYPKEFMPTLLLAAGYQKSGRNTEALPLWQNLANTMPKSNPLYPMITQALAETDKNLAHIPKNTNTLQQPTQQPLPQADNGNNIPSLHINADINITTSLLASLPSNARLFITVSTQGSRMPLIAKALTPSVTQHVSLSEADSMTGQPIDPQSRLTLRAKITGDGTAMSKALAESSVDFTLPITKPLTITLP